MKQNRLLKISFVRPAATISESFTKTNKKWPRWSGNETIGICDVIFGELIFATI